VEKSFDNAPCITDVQIDGSASFLKDFNSKLSPLRNKSKSQFHLHAWHVPESHSSYMVVPLTGRKITGEASFCVKGWVMISPAGGFLVFQGLSGAALLVSVFVVSDVSKIVYF